MTVLFTTQNLEEADYICDRIGIVNNGKKVAEGTSSNLKTKYGALRTLKIGYTSERKIERNDVLKNIEDKDIIEIDIGESEISVVSGKIENVVSQVLQNLSAIGVKSDKIMIDNPTLDDVFMKVIEK